MVQDDLLYTKEHEWVRVEGDVAAIGITDFAQQQLGDIVYVELPAVGARVEFMKAFGTVEAVKAVSDLFSPVSGKWSPPTRLSAPIRHPSRPRPTSTAG